MLSASVLRCMSYWFAGFSFGGSGEVNIEAVLATPFYGVCFRMVFEIVVVVVAVLLVCYFQTEKRRGSS